MKDFRDFVRSELRGHSLAMYSTWLYHEPTRILFDCGEGVSVSMRNYVFGVDKVFLTHGHYDHIGGLAGVVYSRAAARGDKEKPLTVYYPKGCRQVESLRQFVSGSIRHIKYDLKWVELEPGDSVEAGKNLKVVAFKVEHSSGLCLGYKLVERRHRLKRELQGRSPEDIRTIVQAKGRDAVREWYDKIVLAYCGDSAPVRASSVAGAEVLVHEATFLDENDREGRTHSSVREAIETADYAGAESLILFHISGRYDRRDVEKRIRDAAQAAGWKKPLAVLVVYKLVEIQ